MIVLGGGSTGENAAWYAPDVGCAPSGSAVGVADCAGDGRGGHPGVRAQRLATGRCRSTGCQGRSDASIFARRSASTSSSTSSRNARSPGRQGVQHPSVAHRDPIVKRHGVELAGHPAGLPHPLATISPRSLRCTWPGTNWVYELAIATIGLPKSSSPMPVARHSARVPAALRPWVVTRDRRAGVITPLPHRNRRQPDRAASRWQR